MSISLNLQSSEAEQLPAETGFLHSPPVLTHLLDDPQEWSAFGRPVIDGAAQSEGHSARQPAKEGSLPCSPVLPH